MLKVPGPVGQAGVCPVTGRANDPDGFIDTAAELSGFDPRLCLSVSGVRMLAQVAGLPTLNELERAQQEAVDAVDELAAAMSELEELREFRRSVDTIVSADFVARRKPGRPSEKAVA